MAYFSYFVAQRCLNRPPSCVSNNLVMPFAIYSSTNREAFTEHLFDARCAMLTLFSPYLNFSFFPFFSFFREINLGEHLWDSF